MSRPPVTFVAHGAPTLALDLEAGAPLRAWGETLAKPRAILAISAHFEEAPLTIGATEPVPLVYDFYGFPRALYQVQYAAPTAPWLADRVQQLLAGREIARSRRGLDHGIWTPLVHLIPTADVPVLEISMPYTDTAAELFSAGQQLAPLRDEGVAILASGNLVHNLRQLDWTNTAPPPAWASDFDAWSAETLARRDWDGLIDYERRAPAVRLAHPTADHFRPVLVAAGAAADATPRFAIEGWEYGSISRRSLQWD